MPKHHHVVVEGEFRHVIYSPKGAIEGLMLEVDDAPLQVVLEKEHGSDGLLKTLEAGQRIKVEVDQPQATRHEAPGHRVLPLHKVLSLEGRKVSCDETSEPVSGVVVRLNYARHGEPNGVVLDSGDFIHLKPHGMQQLRLKVGSRVTAEGDCRGLSTGKGCVVEARVVNGRQVKK